MPAFPTLTELLAPLGPAAFFSTVWGQRVLHQSGPPERFSFLGLDLATVLDTVAGMPASPDAKPRIRLHQRQSAGGPAVVTGREAVDAHRGEGATIVIDSLDRLVPQVRDFALHLKASMGLAGSDIAINAYISSGEQGFNLHFDNHHVWLLQLVGEKRWRYSQKPAFESPMSNHAQDADARAQEADLHPWEPMFGPGTDDDLTDAATMTPGDSLYIPPGFWHQGDATGVSFALTVSFPTLRVLELIENFLQRTLLEDPAFRRSAPPLWAAPDQRVDMNAWAASLDHAVARFAQAAQALTAPDLARPALRNVFAYDPTCPARLPDAPPLETLRPDDILTHHGLGALRYAIGPTTLGSDPVLVIYGTDAQAELPPDAEPFARGLCEHGSFRADESLAWWPEDELDWDDVAEILTSLLDAGLLRRA